MKDANREYKVFIDMLENASHKVYKEPACFKTPLRFESGLQMCQELNTSTFKQAKHHHSLSLEAKNSSK